MRSINGIGITKRIGAIVLVLGTLFAAGATSTFAQGLYHRDYQSGGQKAATIGGGTAIGAIIGSIAGGGKGAVIGGLIGAGVGTGIVVHKDNQYRNGYYYNGGYYNDYQYGRVYRGRDFDRDRYRDFDHDRYRGSRDFRRYRDNYRH